MEILHWDRNMAILGHGVGEADIALYLGVLRHGLCLALNGFFYYKNGELNML
jgi:hypothetical protein